MDAQTVREQQDRVQLVDVREPEEWRAGRIPGARWIPMADLPDRLGDIEAGRPVVTVCRSGNRSGEMAEYLTERGYHAENLDGGMHAWAEQDLPVRTPDGEEPGRVV